MHLQSLPRYRRVALISVAALVAGIAAVAGAPAAQAEIRCNANGTPKATSGRFANYTNSARVVVTGDKLISGVGWATVTASLPPDTNAWSYAGICDVDKFTVNTTFYVKSAQATGWVAKAAYTNFKSGPGSHYCNNYTSTQIRCSPAVP